MSQSAGRRFRSDIHDRISDRRDPRRLCGRSAQSLTLHESEVIDGYGDDVQRARARLLDTESAWEQVPDTAIEECQSALSHLDPVSWSFYVPAYMSWSLENFLTNESIVCDFTSYTFLLHEEEQCLVAWAQERFRGLDAAQSRAVCRFLRCMADHEGRCDGDAARRALEQTWGRFCQ